MPPPSPAAELRGVSKSYDEARRRHTVLAGADLRLERGELVALYGRSGSGKSTLLNLVAGIDEPSSGRVLVGGRDLGELDERGRSLLRRHEIGFVFQFFNLIPTLTVEENLLLPLELAGRLGKGERRRALGWLDEVGLGERRGSFPDALSGGEQQRLAIARALVHDPLLLLADEPTGNLDPEIADDVLALLERAVRQDGRAMLVATHSHAVARIADRVLRLRDGRLVADEALTAPC